MSMYLSMPPCVANQITYNYFCALGGLSNPSVRKVERRNGTHVYYTYHLCSY